MSAPKWPSCPSEYLTTSMCLGHSEGDSGNGQEDQPCPEHTHGHRLVSDLADDI